MSSTAVTDHNKNMPTNEARGSVSARAAGAAGV